MKKILLSILMLAAATFTFAGTNGAEATNANEKNMSAIIKSQIVFPDFLREKEGEHDATIYFKVTDCGTLAIRSIECDDAALRSDLLDQSVKFKVSTYGLDTNEVYKVVVRFKTLSE